MAEALHEWARALDTLHTQVWKRLERGVADRRAPARHPTLASVDGKGMPQARTVVLRAAHHDTASLNIYTDCHADKVSEVRANPYAALHIWDNIAHLQIRFSTEVVVHTGEALKSIWEQLSDHAQSCYGFHPASGDVIAESLAYEKYPDLKAFAMLELSIQQMDILHLGHRHRRARFQRDDDWAGQWVVP
ncbi:MAG: pyridoxamine 5'-phosphate oxidase family protein [Spiribacter sp.]|jgi:hypothetical protein|nr:pyridoxamine 5'-phosphate oxidase family protein [Spiribacter sp.]MDR9489767.1 pyridoxamine 5'-phosphate oxidase family protein [Spiribacter sp.]